MKIILTIIFLFVVYLASSQTLQWDSYILRKVELGNNRELDSLQRDGVYTAFDNFVKNTLEGSVYNIYAGQDLKRILPQSARAQLIAFADTMSLNGLLFLENGISDIENKKMDMIVLAVAPYFEDPVSGNLQPLFWMSRTDIMQLAMGYQLLHEEKMESLGQYFEDRHFTGKVVKVVRHNFKGNKDFPPELLKKLGLQ